MPNWCYTKITINHEDENKLKELEDKMNDFMSHDYKENGFGLNWLGNIVGNSGIGTVNECPETDLRCRGSVTYMEYIDGQLIIDTKTAWNPCLEMFIKLLEKYLPDAELIYTAEECGECLYVTNDPAIEGNYIIDNYGDIPDIESDWEAAPLQVIDTLQHLLKTEESDVDKLLEMFEASDFVDDLSIHKWEYIEPCNY